MNQIEKRSISYRLKILANEFVLEKSIPLINESIGGFEDSLKNDIKSNFDSLKNYLIITPKGCNELTEILGLIFKKNQLEMEIPSHISRKRNEKAQKNLKSFLDALLDLFKEDFIPKTELIFKRYSIKDGLVRRQLFVSCLNRVFALNKQMINALKGFPKINK